MKSQEKTALIVDDIISFIEHLETEDLRMFNSNILDFKRLPVDNQNILIFIETASTPFNDIINKVRTIRFLDNLLSELLEENKTEQKSILTKDVKILSLPYKDEIKNLLNYLRIKNNLDVNWNEFDDIVDDIFTISREYNLNMKTIYSNIIDIKSISQNILSNFEVSSDIKGWKKLNTLKGVDDIKFQIQNIVKKAKKSIAPYTPSGEIDRLYEVEPIKTDVSLHIILTGNPGTGKTTIAKIIAEIFKEEKILDGGQFIKVTRDDLVAGYVGQTAIKTKEKINQAIGGVLFIDEAYSLSQGGENDFGQEAIDTIVEAMTNYNGRFSVIVAGYPDDMEKFIEANEGLNRRFANKINIDDYTADVLLGIFNSLSKNLEFSKTFKEMIPEFFENVYKLRNKSTGNAGFVTTFYENLLAIDGKIDIDDIPKEYQKYIPTKYKSFGISKETQQELDNLIGMNDVKENIQKIINRIIAAQKRNEQVNAPHIVLTGNPGTGKTTIARILAKVFNELNLLDKKLVEIKMTDLIDSVAGGTQKKTRKLFEKNLGATIFLDEAYELGLNSSGRDAVGEILTFMENNKGQFSFIAAGYPNEMEKYFFGVNAGIKSRVDYVIHIGDYNEQELFEIFMIMLQNKNRKITNEAQIAVREEIEKIVSNKSQHFGNARDIRKLLDKILSNLDDRVVENPNVDLYTIEKDDVLNLEK